MALFLVTANLKKDMTFIAFTFIHTLLIGQYMDILPHSGFVCMSTPNDSSIWRHFCLQSWLAGEIVLFYMFLYLFQAYRME